MVEEFRNGFDELSEDEVTDQKDELKQRTDEFKRPLNQHQTNIDDIQKYNSENNTIIENLKMGYLYSKIVLENGKMRDFISLETNKAFEEIIGINRERIIGKRITEALPGIENDLKDWFDIFQKAAIDKEISTIEQYSAIVNKWFCLTIYSPLEDHFIMLFNDITKQIEAKNVFMKKAELAEIRLERMTSILKATGEGIYSLNSNGYVTFVNPAAENILGFESGELKGKRIHSLIHHSTENIINYENCDICAPLRDGEIHSTNEALFWKKDGSSFPVDYISTPLYTDEKKINGVVVCFQDVSDRRKAEVESLTNETRFNALLAASEARFNNLFAKMEKEIERSQKTAQLYLDVVDVAIFAIDVKGRITLANKKTCQILQYEEEELIGKDWFDNFLLERNRFNERRYFEKLMNDEIGLSDNIKYTVVTKKGGERILSCRSIIITDISDKITGLMISGMDVTDLKWLEDSLQQGLAGLTSVLRS